MIQKYVMLKLKYYFDFNFEISDTTGPRRGKNINKKHAKSAFKNENWQLSRAAL